MNVEDANYIREILNIGATSVFQKLVEKYQDKVFNLCYRIIKNREVAEEIAQDTFLKAYTQLSRLSDHEKFAGWILKIAYTKAIDFIRLKKYRIEDVTQFNNYLPSDEQTPLAKATDANRKELLGRAMNELPAEEAVVIHLYYLEDKSVENTAQITGLTESNVKVKLFRAREALKVILYRLYKDEISELY